MVQNRNVPRPTRDMFPEGIEGDRLFRYMLQLIGDLDIGALGEEDLSIVKATDTGTDSYESSSKGEVPEPDTVIRRDFQSGNTTTTPSLDSLTLTTRDGSALWANALSGPHTLQLASDSGSWLVLDPRPTAANVNNAPVARDGSGNVKGSDPSAAQDFVTKSWHEGDQQVAQAWVNFDGTGTVSIRDHYNVSSITDNGTGDYSVNFSTNLADGNFSAVAVSSDSTRFASCTAHSTSSINVRNSDTSGTLQDDSIISAMVLGGN